MSKPKAIIVSGYFNPLHKGHLELFEKANEPKFNYFPENDDHMMEYNDELLNNIKNIYTSNLATHSNA